MLKVSWNVCTNIIIELTLCWLYLFILFRASWQRVELDPLWACNPMKYNRSRQNMLIRYDVSFNSRRVGHADGWMNLVMWNIDPTTLHSVLCYLLPWIANPACLVVPSSWVNTVLVCNADRFKPWECLGFFPW